MTAIGRHGGTRTNVTATKEVEEGKGLGVTEVVVVEVAEVVTDEGETMTRDKIGMSGMSLRAQCGWPWFVTCGR